MRLMGIIAVLMVFVFLFGCFNTPTAVGNANSSGGSATNGSKVTIIIGQQKNQTITNNNSNGVQEEQPVNASIEYSYDPSQKIGVYFIDASSGSIHGESILIKKGDFDMLVDAGPVESNGKVVDFLKSHDINNIGVLVSTNADPKRYGGLNAIADNFKIQHFWWSGNDNNDPAYKSFISRMESESKAVKAVEAGHSENLDGIDIDVLNPQTKRFNDRDNDAVVLRIVDRNFTILLTSDILVGAQGTLINDGNINAQIMNAPYYGVGTGTSTIGVFLKKVQPKNVIITGSSDDSAQNGGSRTPFKTLMNLYGINWYETYVNGTISVVSDGTSYAVQPIASQ